MGRAKRKCPSVMQYAAVIRSHGMGVSVGEDVTATGITLAAEEGIAVNVSVGATCAAGIVLGAGGDEK